MKGKLFLFLASAMVALSTKPSHDKWVPVGPFGGSVDFVTMHPFGKTLLAASLHGRVFRSEDEGKHWLARPFPAELTSKVHGILFNDADDRHYLIGVSHDHASGNGLYKTSDDGGTWEVIPEFRGKSVWALAAAATDSKIIAAGASDGVYLSKNGGANWHRISAAAKTDLQPVVSIAFDPLDARTIFAGTPHLPWRTEDEGGSWTSIHAGMMDDSDVFSLAPSRQQTGRLFASACSGIYRSEDRGGHWVKLRGSRDASFRTYIIVPDPSDVRRVYAGTTGGLQRSLDGGISWERIHGGVVKSVTVSSNNPMQLFAATSDSGLLRSDDGGNSFKSINEGFEGSSVNAVFSAGGALFVSGNGGASARYGTTGWEAIHPGDAGMFASGSSPSQIFSASARSLWMSADGGVGWKQIPAPTQRGALTALGVVFSAADKTKLWVASSYGGLFEGTAGATTWKPVLVPALENQAVRTIVTSPKLVIVASRRRASVSSDRGATWTHLPLPVPGLEWEGFAVNSLDDSICAATSHGIFLYEKNQWEPTHGADSSTVSGVFFHPQISNLAFAAQQSAVVYSSDGGRNWRALQRSGIPVSAQIKSLTFLPSEPDRMIALVARRGVYTTLIDPKVLRQPSTN